MKLAKQTTLTFVTKIISFVFTLIGSVFMTRLLGVDGQGLYAFVRTNVAFFSMLLGFNMLQALTFFFASDKFDSNKIIALSFLLKIGGFLLFSVVVFILYVFDISVLSLLLPDEYQSWFYVVYILVLFLNTSTVPFFHGKWQGQARFETINYLVLLSSLLNALIFAGYWYYSKYTDVAFSISDVLIGSLSISLILFFVRTVLFLKDRPIFNFDFKSIFYPFLGFCGIGWLTGIFNFGMKRIDIWFIDKFQGLNELGYYSLAANQTDILITLILPVTFVISPYLTKSNQTRQFEILSRFSRITITMMLLLTGLIIICLPFFIPLLYGKEFRPSVFSAQILFVGGLFIIIRNIFSVYNIANKNLKPNLLSTFIYLVITVILN